MYTERMQPLVSIVIPVRGPAKYLEQALRSLTRQTFQNFEVIVVDDRAASGVGDRVHTVIPEAKIVPCDGEGLGVARNTGNKYARGTWVAYIDSDDIWRETKLADQLAIAERYRDAKVIFCSFLEFDEQLHTMLRPKRRRFTYGRALKAVMLDDIALPSTAFCDRKVMMEIGGWPESAQFEDRLFFSKLACKYPFAFLDEPLVFYRKHGGQMSKGHKEGRLEASLAVIEELKKSGYQIDVRTEQKFRAHAYLTASHWHREAGRNSEAIKLAFRALRLEPTNSDYSQLLFRLLLPSGIERYLKHVIASRQTRKVLDDSTDLERYLRS